MHGTGAPPARGAKWLAWAPAPCVGAPSGHAHPNTTSHHWGTSPKSGACGGLRPSGRPPGVGTHTPRSPTQRLGSDVGIVPPTPAMSTRSAHASPERSYGPAQGWRKLFPFPGKLVGPDLDLRTTVSSLARSTSEWAPTQQQFWGFSGAMAWATAATTWVPMGAHTYIVNKRSLKPMPRAIEGFREKSKFERPPCRESLPNNGQPIAK